MKFNRDWLNRVYQAPEDDEGSVGGGSDTTTVQTEIDNTADTDSTNNTTVLTDTNSDAETDTGSADDKGDKGGDTDNADEQTGEGNTSSPDTYADFVMPEGVEVDAVMLTDATPLFKELGLSQEQAQKLIDFQAKHVQASSKSQVDTFNQLMNDWQEQSKNDKEFGGDKFEENVKVAQAAISKFGTPGLKQLLEEHGVGNHPEVIRFMVKVGKLTAEDVPGGSTLPTSKAQDRVSLLYPND